MTTTFWDRGRYVRGNLLYDLAKSAMSRLAFAMAEELRPHGIASVAVSPGWMRTELILAGHRTDEAHWRERPALARTESPRYLGRAVVALAGDPQVMEGAGRCSAWPTSRRSTASPTWTVGGWRHSSSARADSSPGNVPQARFTQPCTSLSSSSARLRPARRSFRSMAVMSGAGSRTASTGFSPLPRGRMGRVGVRPRSS